MHEARLVAADDLGQVGQEGDHVMLGHRLDLVDAGDVEFDVLRLPDRLGVGRGITPSSAMGVAGMGLDLVPDAEFGLRAPRWRPCRGGNSGGSWEPGLSQVVDGTRRVIDCSRSVEQGGADLR